MKGSISSWGALHVEHVQVEGAEEEEGAEDDLEDPHGEVLQIEIVFQSAVHRSEAFNCYQEDGADRQDCIHQEVRDHHDAVL